MCVCLIHVEAKRENQLPGSGLTDGSGLLCGAVSQAQALWRSTVFPIAECLPSLRLSCHGDTLLLCLLCVEDVVLMQPHRHSHMVPFLRARAASPRIVGY